MATSAVTASSAEGVRVTEILSAFSLAGDLGLGQPMGHVQRACVIAMRVAGRMGCDAEALSDIYYTSLLAHAGCTAGAPQFAAFIAADEIVAQRDMCLCDPASARDLLGWVRRNVSPEAPFPLRAGRVAKLLFQADAVFADYERGCSEVGARIAARLGMSQGVQDALLHICETWNGKGPHHLKGEQIPLSARVVSAAMILEVFSSANGHAAAEKAAAKRREKAWDPKVVDAFLSVSGEDVAWEKLDGDELWRLVLDLEPPSNQQHVDERRLDDIVLAFADFADLKAGHIAAHSRRVAALAEAIGQRLGLSSWELALVRRAALVHDLGLVGVSSLILDKTEPLSEAEREQLRIHPYLTERILTRVAALRPLANVAAMHHERLNGSGYPRGASGEQIPVTARIVAVADAFVEMIGDGRGQPALAPDAALSAMRAEAGTQYDAACIEALAQELGAAAERPPTRRSWPGGLSEREVEVLRVLGKGKTNREIAADLFISRKTVGHHLDHIYTKTGVTSRAGAILWAMEHDLLS